MNACAQVLSSSMKMERSFDHHEGTVIKSVRWREGQGSDPNMYASAGNDKVMLLVGTMAW